MADEVQRDQRSGSGTRRLKVRPQSDAARAPPRFGGAIGKQLGTIRLGPPGNTDLQTVFVAGATGRLGARVVRGAPAARAEVRSSTIKSSVLHAYAAFASHQTHHSKVVMEPT